MFRATNPRAAETEQKEGREQKGKEKSKPDEDDEGNEDEYQLCPEHMRKSYESKGCDHTLIFSIKDIHNHACPCEEVLHVKRQGNCRECAAKEPVGPVMSLATFEGILREAGVTEEEMAEMRNRDRGEGNEGKVEGEGEGGKEEEVNGKAASSTGITNQEAHAHSAREHGTQVIHYICGCSHTVIFNNDHDGDQQEVPGHAQAGVMCGRCLDSEGLGRNAVLDEEELKKLVEELKAEKLELEAELRGDCSGTSGF
ncbi:hypothetical protein EG327_009556 [Venturia inaequalis]|uniref:Uncharacterized protein n=1 Tax=Venturia inaequalis TaxID=5025 RepID=A0A8H3VQL4_VENIN|nr:hypothetical protein EG327_009556 [Venturia inaequalis]